MNSKKVTSIPELLEQQKRIIERSKKQCYVLRNGPDIVGIGIVYDSNDPGETSEGIDVIGITWLSGGTCNFTLAHARDLYTLHQIDLNALNL